MTTQVKQNNLDYARARSHTLLDRLQQLDKELTTQVKQNKLQRQPVNILLDR